MDDNFMSCRAPTFTVDAGRPAEKISPTLYGLMTEEINHNYDGGLYAELIQNRAFLDAPKAPVHGSVVSNDDATATIALNDKLTTSLRLEVTKADKKHSAGAANEGYWGISVQPKTTCRATVFAKADANFSGPVKISIVSSDEKKVYATEKFSGLATGRKNFELTPVTGQVTPPAKAHLEITLDQPGAIWHML